MISWILCGGFGLYDILLLPLHALPVAFGYLLFDKIRRPAVRRGWLLALAVPMLICDILYFPFGLRAFFLAMVDAVFVNILLGFGIWAAVRWYRSSRQYK